MNQDPWFIWIVFGDLYHIYVYVHTYVHIFKGIRASMTYLKQSVSLKKRHHSVWWRWGLDLQKYLWSEKLSSQMQLNKIHAHSCLKSFFLFLIEMF